MEQNNVENIFNEECLNNSEENTVIEPDVNKEKSFSQEEVNRIVSERLSKERTKMDKNLSGREEELRIKELKLNARELLSQDTYNNFPRQVLDFLDYSDEKSMNNSLSGLCEIIREDRISHAPKFYGISPVEGVDIYEETDPEAEQIMKDWGL